MKPSLLAMVPVLVVLAKVRDTYLEVRRRLLAGEETGERSYQTPRFAARLILDAEPLSP